MKQKIVIKVCMWCCDKGRSMAMKLAAAADGVESVALDGKHKDELVVVGEDVDSTKLTSTLRKKVGHADILDVSEVVKKDDKKPPPADTAAAPPSKPPPPPPEVTFVCHHCHCHHPVCYGPSYYSCYCYCHWKDDKKPPAAAPAAPSKPPPPEVTFVCHHCHCHHPVCYGSSCYCYCHFH